MDSDTNTATILKKLRQFVLKLDMDRDISDSDIDEFVHIIETDTHYDFDIEGIKANVRQDRRFISGTYAVMVMNAEIAGLVVRDRTMEIDTAISKITSIQPRNDVTTPEEQLLDIAESVKVSLDITKNLIVSALIGDQDGMVKMLHDAIADSKWKSKRRTVLGILALVVIFFVAVYYLF